MRFETNGFVIEVDDHSEEVLKALENAVNRGLKAVGETAVGYAQDLCPKDTGRLAGSITEEVDGNDVYIGTNVEYAPYVEFGTGVYGTQGGRGTPWSYKDEDGNWHHTSGQRAQPYLKPAASDHAGEYANILKDSLENA